MNAQKRHTTWLTLILFAAAFYWLDRNWVDFKRGFMGRPAVEIRGK